MTDRLRPTSISVIGWLLVVLGALAIPLGIRHYFQRTPLPLGISQSAALLQYVLGGIMQLVVGTAILKGFGWGRWLYVVSVPVMVGIGVALSHTVLWSQLLGVAGYVTLVFFLFRPSSSRFFAQNATKD